MRFEKVQKVQSMFAHSWQMSRELANNQKRFNMPLIKIPSFCKTRWWSRLHLLEAIVNTDIPLNNVLSTYKNNKHKNDVFSIEDIDLLKIIIDVLKPIEKISEILAGEKYATASLIIPICRQLSRDFDNVDPDETQLNEPTVRSTFLLHIREYLEKRYMDQKHIKMHLLKATLFDPRFKLNELEADDGNEVQAQIIQEMENLIVEIQPSPKRVKQTKGLSFLFGTNEVHELSDAEELRKYIMLPNIDIDSNPLEWWRLQGNCFPKLLMLAKKYLCSPGTSVPSERVFSRAGNVVTDNRSCLTGQHSEELIMLALNENLITK